MIKAIIFDYFDVLVRDDYWHQVSERAATDGFKGIVAELNVQVNDGTISWRQFCEIVGTKMGVSPDVVDENYHKLQLNKRLVMYAQGLKDAGYKIGLLSNAASEYLRPILQSSGLEHLFDAVGISTELGAIKPNERAFLKTTQMLGVEPAEAVMIDDASHNVAGAKNAGLQAVEYRTYEQAIAELENLLAKHA